MATGARLRTKRVAVQEEDKFGIAEVTFHEGSSPEVSPVHGWYLVKFINHEPPKLWAGPFHTEKDARNWMDENPQMFLI